jgi:hypothetical protein
MNNYNRINPCWILIVVGVFGLAGCQEASVSTAPAQTTRADYFIPLATPEGHTSLWDLYQEPDAARRAANVEEIKSISIAQTELMQAVKQAATWQEADQLVRTQLARFQDHVLLHQLEQVGASNMLEHHLLASAQGESTTAALAFYTEMLVRNSHPDSHLLSRAFDALKGTWPPETLARYAQQTVAHAETWLAGRVANVRDCTGADCLAAKLPDAENDPMQVRAHHMLAALTTLRAIH